MKHDTQQSAPACLRGGGTVGALMRAKDWSATSLGDPDSWSPKLSAYIMLVLESRQPMFVAWGPDLCFLYNDAHALILGSKHPSALGKPFKLVWSDIWEQFEPIVQATIGGEAQLFEDLPVEMARNGGSETAFFDFSYTPLRDEHEAPVGLFCVATETTSKIQAERDVVADKTRLSDLFEQAPGFMCVLRGPEHRFEMMNAAYLQLVGHRDFIGQSVLEALPEVEGQGFIELLDGVFRDAETFVGRQMPFHVQRTPGAPLELRYVDLVYQPILDAAGQVTGIFVEGSDVTETREAQEALRESEAFIRRVLESSTDCIKVLSLEGDLEFMSIGGQGVMEVDDFETVRGSCWTKFWRGDENPKAVEAMAQANAGSTGRFRGYTPTLKGNMRFWDVIVTPINDADGRPEKLLSISRDVTEANEAQSALKELNDTLEQQVAERTSERNLLATIVETTDAFIQVADLDYRYLAINKASADEFERVYGVRPKVGDNILDLLLGHPAEREALKAAWGRALAGEEYTFTGAFGDPDRNRPHYEIKFNTLRDERGERIGAYQFVYDVSERIADQTRLVETQEQLRQSQKMEAVGQLTGGIAHDFNNLLQGITGSLDLVKKRIAQGRMSKVERFVSGAVTSANRAAALTHRLLAFSRRQPLDPKPIAANPLVASMEDLLRRTLGETIELELVLAGGLWPTLCDGNQLENALLNLAINARDAMPEGGKLTVETCNAHLDAAYAARARDVTPGQYVCICVTDSGGGMPPEVVERAFDPFFTTKAIGQGTGLGLSMIYGFARQSEGHCKIYSEIGRGTTIKLYLPRHRGDAAEVEPIRCLSEAQGTEHGEVVVVIEDEPVVRGLIVEVLLELGYRALEAHDGPSGLALLEATPRVDLVVTDIGLPGLNGRQVVDAARVKRPGMKVLFMTGYAENAAVANGFLEPGMSMLTKPFAMEALATRIRSIIEAR